MIVGARWYLVTLVRASTDSRICLHVDANSESEAEIYARRQMSRRSGTVTRYTWVVEDCVEIENYPAWAPEEYKGCKFWEELEDDNEHMKSFFYVLYPGRANAVFVRNIKNRKELLDFLDTQLGEKEYNPCTH